MPAEPFPWLDEHKPEYVLVNTLARLLTDNDVQDKQRKEELASLHTGLEEALRSVAEQRVEIEAAKLPRFFFRKSENRKRSNRLSHNDHKKKKIEDTITVLDAYLGLEARTHNP